MKRLLTDSEMRDLINYYAKCQSLRDFIDLKVVPSNFHYQKIKQYTNLLAHEIEKQIDVLMKTSEEDPMAVIDQFVNASIQSDYLFDVALKLEGIEYEKKVECATRISNVLKEYGIQ